MNPQKHLLATFSILLITVLLAACAAPAAAPTATPVPPTATQAPPTPTPVPTEAAPDPVAVAQAWMNAISGGDVDAALALVTDDVRFVFSGEGGSGPAMMGRYLNWWAGIDTKYQILDCQTEGNQASCNVALVDGCIAAAGYPDGLPVTIRFVIGQDGKVGEITAPTVGEQWGAYGKQADVATNWMKENRAEELAKRDWSREYGPTQVRLCQDWQAAMKTQPPATAAASQRLVDSINSGDVNAAMAPLAENAEFQFWKDKGAGMEQLRSMFAWLAGKETQFRITDCEWQGNGTKCAMTVLDGCITAFGASDGLPGKMTFDSLEDGTLRSVSGVLAVVDRKAYQTWLEAETAWAGANRAEEFAQTEGYSREAGAMAVKLCQEYATAVETPSSTPAAP